MKKHLLLTISVLSSLLGFAQFVSTNGPLQESTIGYLWARNDTAFTAKGENLWRTTDGGSSWDVLIGTGLPNTVDPRAITVARNIVFVGTNNGSRVYTSSDWGDTWTANSGGAIWVPTHASSDGNTVLMGGTTFPPHYFDFDQNIWVSSGLGGITHAIRVQDDGTAIVNVGSPTSGRTHISNDGGKTWTQITDEPSAFTARTYDIIKIGSRLVSVVNVNGSNPFYSDDNGDTWTEATGAKTGALFAYGRKFGKLSDGTLLFYSSRSIDSGATWTAGNKSFGGDFMPWKTNNILGVYGDVEDAGLGKCTGFSFPTTGAGLVVYKNELHTYTGNSANMENQYWSHYNGSRWATDSVTNNTSQFGVAAINNVSMVDDSLYLHTLSGMLGGTNNTFDSYHRSAFSNKNIGKFAKVGSLYLAGTYEYNASVKPTIFYSSDRTVWTAASFSNNIGWGPAGTANYVQGFLEHKGKLYADFNGGYAVSADEGVTWEWKGGTTAGNLVTDGTVLVRLNDPIFSTKKLQYSEDGGDNWVEALDGIPGYTGQSNFVMFGNVYEADGTIYLDAWEGTRKLMQFDNATKKWKDTDKNSTLPKNGILYSLVSYNSILHAQIQEQGIWKLDGTVNSISKTSQNLGTYPNPTQGIVHLKILLDKISIINPQGQEVLSLDLPSQTLDLSDLSSGIYYLSGFQNEIQFQTKIIKQ